MVLKRHKDGYVVSCSSAFRDRILALAEKKNVNPGDLARSMILALPHQDIDSFPDPGEPEKQDRETVTLQSGAHNGKIWKRKPRLQVRMPAGYNMVFLRKALGVALAVEEKKAKTALLSDHKKADASEQKNSQDTESLHNMVSVLAFQKLPQGCQNTDDALYIFGLPRRPIPDSGLLRRRYRELATIFHPDSLIGDHERMATINSAMSLFKSIKML